MAISSIKTKFKQKLFCVCAIPVTALVSCSGQPAPAPTVPADGSIAHVEILEDINPVTTELERMVISQPNCNGVSEILNSYSKSHTVTHTAEVEGEYQLSSDGTLGIGGTGVSLGYAIAARLGYTYGSSVEETAAVEVKAAPGTHMEHIIRTDEIWKAGTAKITLLNKEIFLPFKFRTGFRVEVEGSRPLICPPGNEPVPSNTPYLLVTNTSIPLPTARVITLTPSPVPINQGSGTQGGDQPTTSAGGVVPTTSVQPIAATPTLTSVPPTLTSVPPSRTPIPPTITSVPPTQTSEPTTAPSLKFQWDVNAVCSSLGDFVQIRVLNDNSVSVEVLGTIKAHPDGGNETTIADVPDHNKICSAGDWCGPIAGLRSNLFPSGSGRVWGSASVYYQGVEVSSNSIDVNITCTD